MTTKPLVIVSHTLPETWLAPLYEACRVIVGPETAVSPTLTKKLLAHLPEAEGLLTLLTQPVNDQLLDQAPNLKVVSQMAVGVDNIDLDACTARGIPVGHTPGVLTEGTADLTLAIMLAQARRLPEASADAKADKWQTWSPTAWLGKDIAGATVGIVGMGKIGRAVAKRVQAFDCRIVYHSRRQYEDVNDAYNATWLSLNDLLQRSDYVCLHVPLSDETHHLIDEAALKLMKSDAMLVNVARGAVVDTNALYRALTEGWIGSAALDVTDPEPLPAIHPLYQLDNCLIVPHIGSATLKTRERMAGLAVQNLLAGIRGERLLHRAN